MFRRLLAGLVALLTIVGCGGSDDSASPSATVARPESTSTSTSTSSVPRTPEEEVEAAYLESWEIYTEAVRELDDSRLPEAYQRAALQTIRDEVARLRESRTPVRCEVEHDYTVDVGGSRYASVVDEYVNHCVLLNEAGEPIEEDPNERVRELYLFERFEDGWKVIGIQDPP